MLLTITNTQSPATDLGYLLHKNPNRLQTFELAFGQAQVFYPEVSQERCTVALLLEIDPIGLVRGKVGSSEGGPLQQYVNDRPYVASSFLSVAIKQVFGSALAGRCKEKPEIAAATLPLEACLAAVPARGGESLLRKLFEPLGYTLEIENYPLDETVPEWGRSPYYTLKLQATCRLSDLLTHLYVLIPVLDETKHYWVGDDEVEKLFKHGEGWLAQHPERNLITRRYLKYRPLIQSALARLVELDEIEPAKLAETASSVEESVLEERISLNQQRLEAVSHVLRQNGVKRVVDLGCGEGKLLQILLEDKNFEEIVGMDVAYQTLQNARERLHFESLALHQQNRIKLLQGSLTYQDRRLAGYDAATVIEVIEHLDQSRLQTFERILFGQTRPRMIILTTPNAEYNAKFEDLPSGKFRHKDHRFEWTRAEFETWATHAANQFGYKVNFEPIGELDPLLGAPTQMGIFKLP